jgi:hypothetical protein
MPHLKRFSAVFMLFTVAIRAGATPVAVSQLQTDLSAATISFTYGTDGGVATKIGNANPDNYAQVSTGETSAEEEKQFDGTAAASVSNASAAAKSKNGATWNYASATGNENVTTAYSKTSSYIIYHLVNVTSISLSVDAVASLDLSAGNPDEEAFGYWDAYLEMFSDGIFSVNCDSSSVNDVYYGDPSVSEDNQKKSLSLFFDGFESPFTGDVTIHTLNQTYVDVHTLEAPESVPEPASLGLFAVGMVMIGFARRFRSTKTK